MNRLVEKIERVPLWAVSLLIVALAFVQYGNTLGLGYVLDDQIVITDNARVQKGLAGMGEHFSRNQSELLMDQYGYRPVTLCTFSLDVSLFGMKPWGGHLMNVVWFSLCCVLVLLSVVKLFPSLPRLFALTGCVLFVVHPIHVEAVANIKSRDEILVLLWGLCAVWLLVEMLRSGRWWLGLPLAAAVGLALLSKESGITYAALLPLTALFAEGMPLRRKLAGGGASLVLCAVLGLGVAGLGAANTVVDYSETEGKGIQRESKLMGNALFQHHLPRDRYATGLDIARRYVQKYVVPYPLVYYSGFNQVPLRHWGDAGVWLGLVLHLGLLGLAVYWVRRAAPASFGLFFYFISLSPYTHFVRPLDDAMADRFLYSPSLGLGLCAAGALHLLWRGRQPAAGGKAVKGPAARRGWVLALPLVAVVPFFLLTLNRNKVWADNHTLFSHDIAYLEDCARCHFHYAEQLTGRYPQSLPGQQAAMRAEIIHHFRRAIEITDEAYNSYLALGRAYHVFGMHAEGDAVLEKAIRKWPESGRPYFHYGYGKYVQREYAAATAALEKAKRLAPNSEDTWFFLSWSLFQGGRNGEGIALMEEAKVKWPQTMSWYESLSDMYAAVGLHAESMDVLHSAIGVNAQHGAAYAKLIEKYLAFGDSSHAELIRAKARQNGVY